MLQDRAEERVAIGRVSGVYGVRGWLRVSSSTRPMERMLDYRPWHLARDGGWCRVELRAGRRHGSSLLAKLEGIEDRDAAKAWVGSEVAVERDRLPDTDEGEYYWFDLIGAEVVDAGGRRLGRVQGLMETGANDVMVVRGERERLIPFIVEQVVKAVDLDARRITVDWDSEL